MGRAVRRFSNPSTVAPTVGSYSHAVEVQNGRLLFISGQVPETPEGTIPAGFAAQCEQVWQNILAILIANDLTPEHLVKINTFLTHPDQADQNGQIRRGHLKTHAPALTVVVAQTLNSAWLLEIEAVAFQSQQEVS